MPQQGPFRQTIFSIYADSAGPLINSLDAERIMHPEPSAARNSRLPRPSPASMWRRGAYFLPGVADREETQRYHRYGDEHENRRKAKPNYMHFVQSDLQRLRFVLKPSLCFVYAYYYCSATGSFVRGEARRIFVGETCGLSAASGRKPRIPAKRSPAG